MTEKPALLFLIIGAQALATLLLLAIAIWGSFALYYQWSESRLLNALAIGLWLLVAAALISTLWLSNLHDYRKGAALLFIALFCGLLLWWQTMIPSLERQWAADVAHTFTAEQKGSQITLHNIRDFDWRSETDFTPHWKTADFDLEQISTVDLFLSYWSSPAIAHTLVSFGFKDGRHIVFSAEIRKKFDQSFSEIGGFFRQFELAMIAAEESDIIFLRTNIRGEQVYRYPIDITAQQARELFVLYTKKANHLSEEPDFYNTITANCTTVVFDMAKILNPAILFDYRILLSGYLPEYIRDNHLVLSDESDIAILRQQAHINALAQGPREHYSRRIRAQPAQ